MLTRRNLNYCINHLSDDDKKNIKTTDNEYTEVHCSSYNHVWVNSFTNDLPSNYDHLIADGCVYFFQTSELIEILNKGNND